MNPEEENQTPPAEPDPETPAAKVPFVKANGKWADAPTAVKAALALDIWFVLVGAFIFLNGAKSLSSPEGLIPCLILSFMGGTYILVGLWLWNAVRWGEKGARNAQMSLAVLGIFCIGVGTVLAAMVFAGKDKDEVKAWYGE